MLTIRKIRGNELKRFKKLEGEYHYMGETRSGGDTLRLVAEEDGEWVALTVWGSALAGFSLFAGLFVVSRWKKSRIAKVRLRLWQGYAEAQIVITKVRCSVLSICGTA